LKVKMADERSYQRRNNAESVGKWKVKENPHGSQKMTDADAVCLTPTNRRVDTVTKDGVGLEFHVK
ncbi:hypothetical protein Ancab_017284, partial [Ancistrocladus abbreviatus]